MSGYAIENLREIEAEGPEGAEFRFSRKHLDSEQLGITYERFPAGFFISTNGHRHEVQEEALVKDRWPAG